MIWYTIHCQEQACAGPHSPAMRTAQSGKTVNEEAAETYMSEWFFRKKSKGEVERDPGWDEYFTSNRSTDDSPTRGNGMTGSAAQWKGAGE